MRLPKWQPVPIMGIDEGRTTNGKIKGYDSASRSPYQDGYRPLYTVTGKTMLAKRIPTILPPLGLSQGLVEMRCVLYHRVNDLRSAAAAMPVAARCTRRRVLQRGMA